MKLSSSSFFAPLSRICAIICLVFFLLCSFSVFGYARNLSPVDGFEKYIEEAKKHLLAKEPAATLAALRKATAEAWRRFPFTAVNVHLVAAQPAGYGRFIPRVDNVFRPGEPLILYLEPVGFVVKEDKNTGKYRYRLVADFNMVDAWGRVVSGRRTVGRFEGETAQFPDRYPLTFTYSLSGLPPGEYKVETIIRDLLGKKSHTVVTPIRVEGP
ncbi:hypothetical protein [Dethiosulfatarculus sandiegensis]|uniref:Uncharacterized protein n=1 Tax=Dethiosulfatarculus sandiegensis TaxID=1429043 RepID=A0A0D2HZJ9_9BACT|nr:hypothetical protein [Dethiosulfatarculus sandiegensis]KIX15703.1 hypothetical protein X474_02460 [Dethiosulfatarculus sandiegensis]